VRRRRLAIAAAGLLALGFAAFARPMPLLGGGDPAIRGAAPNYGPGWVSTMPNAAAIGERIWMPGLDDGYTPQGLAIIGGEFFVSAYWSDKFQVQRGPCRVFRIDRGSGAETGRFDVPLPCGHAGGLAYAGGPRLYLSDTNTLFSIDLPRALAGLPGAFRQHPYGPGVRGGLAASDAGAIWLGSYREDGPGRLLRFPVSAIDILPDGATLPAEYSTMQRAIPPRAQGAALDRAGKLWVSSSNCCWGALDRIDLATGVIERRFDAAAQLEGIAFDESGRLWAGSESGARHFYDQPVVGWFQSFHPLIFAIDTARLE